MEFANTLLQKTHNSQMFSQGVQHELEYQLNMQNDKWALYGTSITWGKLHSLCFISHFIPCLSMGHLMMLSVLYLYSVSSKLINMNMRHWWMFLSLMIHNNKRLNHAIPSRKYCKCVALFPILIETRGCLFIL
jgi:hypothetical protein